MSITQGLFSDVLANAPQAFRPSEASIALSSLARPADLRQGSADWSKTLPMYGAVDWANVRPFQVINPLTGYSYGATQPTQASSSSSQEDKPQLSEYQKWLAQQSKPDTNMTGEHGDSRATPTDYGAVIGDPSASGKAWGELTSAQQNAYSAAVDPYGIGPMIAKGVQASVPGASFIPGVLDNLMGRTGAPDQRAAPIGGWMGGLIGGIQPTSTNAQIANAASPAGWGNLSSTPVGGTGTMALDPAQRAAAEAEAAREAATIGGFTDVGGGGKAANDALGEMGII